MTAGELASKSLNGDGDLLLVVTLAPARNMALALLLCSADGRDATAAASLSFLLIDTALEADPPLAAALRVLLWLPLLRAGTRGGRRRALCFGVSLSPLFRLPVPLLLAACFLLLLLPLLPPLLASARELPRLLMPFFFELTPLTCPVTLLGEEEVSGCFCCSCFCGFR